MSEHTGRTPTPDDVPTVPGSAWALGWSFVVGQLLELVRRGAQQESAWPLSMAFGVVVVVLVSHGVMRVRWVRFWLAATVLVLAPVFIGIGLVIEPTAWGLVTLLIALVQAALLRAYSRTDWFAWQRTRPSGGPSLVPIVAVAALVGALSGVVGTPTDGFGASVNS